VDRTFNKAWCLLWTTVPHPAAVQGREEESLDVRKYVVNNWFCGRWVQATVGGFFIYRGNTHPRLPTFIINFVSFRIVALNLDTEFLSMPCCQGALASMKALRDLSVEFRRVPHTLASMSLPPGLKHINYKDMTRGLRPPFPVLSGIIKLASFQLLSYSYIREEGGSFHLIDDVFHGHTQIELEILDIHRSSFKLFDTRGSNIDRVLAGFDDIYFFQVPSNVETYKVYDTPRHGGMRILTDPDTRMTWGELNFGL